MNNSGFFQHLRENYNNLSESEKEVIDYITKYENIEQLKIKTIEQELFISSATIVRAGKKLGYPTFNTLKYALINSKTEKQKNDVNTSYQEILYTKKTDFERTLELLEEDKMINISQKLLQARQVFCVATGSSTSVAREFSRRLKLVDIWANEYTEKFPMERISTNATKEDVIIVFSLSGQDDDVNEALLRTKKNGTTIISITNISSNPLASFSDISVFVYASPSKRAKVRSRLSLYVACDVIFETVMMQKSL